MRDPFTMYLGRQGGFPHPTEPARMVSAADAAALGIVDRMPFFLEAGKYAEAVNRFLRHLPASGCRSRHTWRGYANDLSAFARWLDVARGKTLWEATPDDTAAYFCLRRIDASSFRLSKASWNRALAALERLYQWAVAEGLVPRPPFEYRYRRRWAARERTLGDAPRGRARGAIPEGGGDERDAGAYVNTLHETTSRDRAPSFVTAEAFRVFRDVGLRGLRPDGSPDPDYHARQGERNATFANICFTTGLRNEEASTLLTTELPLHAARTPGAGGRAAEQVFSVQLAEDCAKGNKSRVVYFPRRVLRDVATYVDVDRAVDVGKAVDTTGYRGVRAPILVTTSRGGDALRRADDARILRPGALGPAERRRLVLVRDGRPAEPVFLFVSDRGTPVAEGIWSKVFRDASARCRAFGWPLDVTPHDLRHSYAVHLLSRMLHGLRARATLPDDAVPGARAYEALTGDALMELRVRLGHASITSTYGYLRCLKEVRELGDDAAIALAADAYDGGDE